MIPDFQTIMLPILQILSEKEELESRQLPDLISDKFNLTDEERVELLPSGTQAIIFNRVAWAKTYLVKAALLESPKRGLLKITEAGKKVLTSKPKRIDVKYLRTFPIFNEWKSSSKKGSERATQIEVETDVQSTPEELLEYSFNKLREELTIDLLTLIKTQTPAFFEKLVVDLLLKMGYGGSRKEAGQVLGRSGDGGIDGIIKEDKLGLDAIYVQAKKWENQVTISSVRDFAGSLMSKKAKKGIMITTSDFPKSAHDFVANIELKVVLINGKELAELMIENGVGVATRNLFELKKIDHDYFEEI